MTSPVFPIRICYGIFLITLAGTVSLLAQGSSTPASAGSALEAQPEATVSLGLYVTTSRISKVTSNGMAAIPEGALVSVVESAGGQKYAVFRNVRVPISGFEQLTKDPAKVAAASTSKGAANPGAAVTDQANMAPQANSKEQITLDASGNVISRTKMTTVSDGSGNTTVIKQGSDTGEVAARIAMGEERIRQQRLAIWEFKAKRYEKAVVSGYNSKLKAMEELLVRMEAEVARLRAVSQQ